LILAVKGNNVDVVRLLLDSVEVGAYAVRKALKECTSDTGSEIESLLLEEVGLDACIE
jgi:hypothetical protein